jgi:hypothetical protein
VVVVVVVVGGGSFFEFSGINTRQCLQFVKRDVCFVSATRQNYFRVINMCEMEYKHRTANSYSLQRAAKASGDSSTEHEGQYATRKKKSDFLSYGLGELE